MNQLRRIMLAVSLLAIGVILYPGAIAAMPPAQSQIVLGVDPMLITVNQGEEFDLTLYVDSGDQPIDGCQATLAYDPICLTVLSLTPIDTLPDAFPPPSLLPNGYSNSEGRLSYAAGKLFGDLPQGRFDVLIIHVRAGSPTTGTLMQFVDDARLPTSRLTYGGEMLGINLVAGVVTINQSDAPTSTLEPTRTPTNPANTPPPTSTSEYYPGPAESPTATWTPSPTFTPTETPTETPTAIPATGTATIAPSATLPPRREQSPSPLPTGPVESATETPSPTAIETPAAAEPTATIVEPTTTPPSAAEATATMTETPATLPTDTPPPNAGQDALTPGVTPENLAKSDVSGVATPAAEPTSLLTRLLTTNIWGTMAIVAIALSVGAFMILRRQFIAPDDDDDEDDEGDTGEGKA